IDSKSVPKKNDVKILNGNNEKAAFSVLNSKYNLLRKDHADLLNEMEIKNLKNHELQSQIVADGSLWEPSSRSRICSQHFVEGEKSEHPNSPAYIPTIFPEKYYGTQKNTQTVQLRAQNRGVTCEAGTQSNIFIEESEKKIIISNSTADKGCGPTIQHADKQVGPNPLDENDLLLANRKGFCGFPSIKNEQDLIDLAGVSFKRFQLLL
ncbi:hypothetical protein PV328_011934, partial [Microctonus aethiopoides]